ncbi:hypothetical protein [Paraburkholderia tropica]|uniref:hypothetical protein n=1 Tax=Paraburkholderia tropica TaxID=92647 RepID=UPI001CC40817|nr:hypothetical protein [Paraburkholderia tropica]
MKTTRENLLELLWTSYAAGQALAKPLKELSAAVPNPGEVTDLTRQLVSKTIYHQTLLLQCLSRIDSNPTHLLTNDSDNASENCRKTLTDTNVPDKLAHLRSCLLNRTDLLYLVIDAAESTGFFETKWVCESILTEISSVVSKLDLIASVDDPFSYERTAT